MSVENLLQQVLTRLSAIEAKIGSEGGDSKSCDNGGAALPKAVSAFDDYIEACMGPFLAACNTLGGDCATQGAFLDAAWAEMRNFIVMACACKAPADKDLMGLLGGVAAKMKAVTGNTPRGEHERHCKAIAEGVGAMNWLCVKPAPKDIVETGLDGFQFIANKIRVEFKSGNPDQIAFCDTGKALFSGLVDYVLTHHKAGLKWNAMGGDAKSFTPGATTASAAPTPAPAPAAVSTSEKPKVADSAGLFASLNKGLDVTGGLKKVTKEMKSSNLPPAAPVVAKAPVPKVNNNKPKGTAKCELAPGGKWNVEYQDSSCDIEITNSKQMVYIYGCIGANINITGKCKTITVDSCKKTTIHFDDVMASCEVVNSQRCHIDVRNLCPAMALDKVDGCTVFCSETAKNSIELSCAKISEINLQWMDSEGELVEKPVPEQYVHRVKDNAITVDVSDLYSC